MTMIDLKKAAAILTLAAAPIIICVLLNNLINNLGL